MGVLGKIQVHSFEVNGKYNKPIKITHEFANRHMYQIILGKMAGWLAFMQHFASLVHDVALITWRIELRQPIC